MRIDTLKEGPQDQVSSYIKERKILKYVKELLQDSKKFSKYESRTLSAKGNLVEVLFDRMTSKQDISIEDLFSTIPK